jgi:CheY-like chemotaxis protein
VLVNLLSNAVKFTEKGEVRLSVVFVAGNADELTLQFTVKDSGIGVPENKQKVIFEMFSQADASTTRKFGGTGLGLSISSRLVEMMGGTIWVESRLGQGSQFHFTATLGRATDRREFAEPQTNQSSGLQQSMRDGSTKLNVLVVEDNRINQIVLVRLLQSWGHSSVVADNGHAALDILARESFDLLITDVQMPEMDGYDLVTAIRAREKVNGNCLPIIGLTAHAREEDRGLCLAVGMDAYLTKPIRPDDLCATMVTLAARLLTTQT